MSNCCTPKNKTQSTNRHVCPINNKQYTTVPYTTVLHHVKQAWKFTAIQENYYFCSDPNCDVVYFALDNSVILKNQLRTKVGIKEISEDSLLCYCFGVTRQLAITDKDIKAFVIEQTRSGLCACSAYNPSGRCCLKDFPK